MLKAVIKKNDRNAKILIITFSVIVFSVVAALGKIHVNIQVDFDVHLFALISAIINTCVSFLLIAALIAVKRRNFELHKKLMMIAIVLSVLFLISYIGHHLLAGETKFGGTGLVKILYLIILLTHIVLASTSLPFILFTAYRALTADFARHKKIARIIYPIWLYVAVTGVVVYLMISPYYK